MQVHAADLRHHQITEQQIERPIFLQDLHRLPPAGSRHHRVVFLQRVTQNARDRRFIIHDQDAASAL
jgi:hypothetical protein